MSTATFPTSIPSYGQIETEHKQIERIARDLEAVCTKLGTGAATVSVAGNFATAGAYACTLTCTAPTNVTLPTTGTLATRAGAETLTNKTIVDRVGADIVGDVTVAIADGDIFACKPAAATVVTLGTMGIANGNKFTFTNDGGYAFTVDIGGLHTMSASKKSIVEVHRIGAAFALTYLYQEA